MPLSATTGLQTANRQTPASGPGKEGEKMKQNAWKIILQGKHIDTVFYNIGFDAEYVRQSLIDHDGYNPAIKVIKEV